MTILAEDRNGARRETRFSYNDMVPAKTSNDLEAALPQITDQTKYVFVAIDRPTNNLTLTSARLLPPQTAFSAWEISNMLLLAALCGMMAMPLIFNTACYRVLREPFVIWQAALALSLLATIFLESGLISVFFSLSPSVLSVLSPFSISISVATGLMFTHSFIEPERMDSRLRRALPTLAVWIILVAIWHAAFPFTLRPWHNEIFYFGFLPPMLGLIFALFSGLRRGSRAAKFQLVGWTPMFMVGALRIVSTASPLVPSTDAATLFYFGCVFEVVATSLGVADRFMKIKRERDRARSETQVFEELSERDTLTGLYNRRLLQERFGELRKEGFTTLAVLDLDHFKAVNDTFGHAAGDDVLRAVGAALAGDDDMIGVRLGGEEFLLLLRGEDTIRRAEAARRSITRGVLDSVRLDRPVTASMGVIDAPADGPGDASFETIYNHADRLLYDAKAAGRNRSISQQMAIFDRRACADRRAAA